jgi:queuine/archaeosine tRNA-ribosyltransferase
MKMGDRIFVLAHLWVQYPHYRDFIYSLIDDDIDRWITLDNSAAERALVTEDVLIDIVHQLAPSEVIAPDVLFDKEETIKNARAFQIRMEKEGLLEATDIFFCPQGKTKEDWLEAYEWALKQDWIQTIGFSKIAVPQAWLPEWKDDQGIKEARHMAYDYLKEKGLLVKPIHCLGQGDPTEFAYYNHPAMRSTDSVFPILAAAHGQDFEKDHTTRIPTPHNFLESYDMSQIDMDLVKSNVEFLRQSCKKDFF